MGAGPLSPRRRELSGVMAAAATSDWSVQVRKIIFTFPLAQHICGGAVQPAAKGISVAHDQLRPLPFQVCRSVRPDRPRIFQRKQFWGQAPAHSSKARLTNSKAAAAHCGPVARHRRSPSRSAANISLCSSGRRRCGLFKIRPWPQRREGCVDVDGVGIAGEVHRVHTVVRKWRRSQSMPLRLVVKPCCTIRSLPIRSTSAASNSGSVSVVTKVFLRRPAQALLH